uniref:Forkhead box protein G1 n=1 Tax=Gouania willdenowi TaxID=441366 RepID=A0A8C5GG59_GOUWI
MINSVIFLNQVNKYCSICTIFEHLPSQTRILDFPMSGAKMFSTDRLEMYTEDQVQGFRPAPLDDDLTSLHWLQNFSISMQPIPQVEVDYKTNPNVKPPYTYKSLICMTMQASKQPKVTLSTICKWITENFCYYRHADPSWQKAIRWNLSTKKCFRKVPRQKDEPGKGGFWQIDPEYSDRLLKGCYNSPFPPPRRHTRRPESQSLSLSYRPTTGHILR